MLHGQEIHLFFYRFGFYGVIGLLICSILIGLIIYKTFIIVSINAYRLDNYEDFLNIIFNSKNNKNRLFNISSVSNIVINTFLLITFYIMASGISTYFNQQLGVNKILSSILFSTICYFALKNNISGVTRINNVIVPILIFIIISLGLVNFKKINLNLDYSYNNIDFLLNSILYCSYNMILLIPLLITLSKNIKNNKQIKKTACITSIIIFSLASSIFFALSRINADYEKIQMPLVFLIDKIYPEFKTIYGIAIILSIISTAISVGISFLHNITKEKKIYIYYLKTMCITSVIISKIEFASLVKIMFPVFGYVGLLQIAFIIKYKIEKHSCSGKN